MKEEYPTFIADVGALAMGSTTYEWIAAYTGFLDDPSKWDYAQPTWVFSSRNLPRRDDLDIRFVSGDVRPVHAEMVEAAAGKNVWMVGGGELVGQFHDHGLLDEVILGVAPVFLGAGAPLLPRKITTPPLEADRRHPVRRHLRQPPVRRAALTIGAPSMGLDGPALHCKLLCCHASSTARSARPVATAGQPHHDVDEGDTMVTTRRKSTKKSAAKKSPGEGMPASRPASVAKKSSGHEVGSHEVGGEEVSGHEVGSHRGRWRRSPRPRSRRSRGRWRRSRRPRSRWPRSLRPRSRWRRSPRPRSRQSQVGGEEVGGERSVAKKSPAKKSAVTRSVARSRRPRSRQSESEPRSRRQRRPQRRGARSTTSAPTNRQSQVQETAEGPRLSGVTSATRSGRR